jgi:hypothetical protein
MLIKQRFVHWRSDTPLLPAVSLITPAYFAAGDTNVGIGQDKSRMRYVVAKIMCAQRTTPFEMNSGPSTKTT